MIKQSFFDAKNRLSTVILGLWWLATHWKVVAWLRFERIQKKSVIGTQVWNWNTSSLVSGIEGNQYQYDLFVSFSGSDFHWVNDKLMPLLEKEQIKYCIHHRDFEVGKALIDNIADSVYNSKKVSSG